jgi:hypothetical protein
MSQTQPHIDRPISLYDTGPFGGLSAAVFVVFEPLMQRNGQKRNKRSKEKTTETKLP